jgi:hypothetical protein
MPFQGIVGVEEDLHEKNFNHNYVDFVLLKTCARVSVIHSVFTLD